MKLKILMLAASIAILASCGPSYRVTDESTVGIDVPVVVKKSFTTAYPSATQVVWTMYDASVVPIDWDLTGWPAMDQSDYVVTFNMNNEKYYAYYDVNGDWIGTAYVITDYKSLPSGINTMIADKYAGYSITS